MKEYGIMKKMLKTKHLKMIKIEEVFNKYQKKILTKIKYKQFNKIKKIRVSLLLLRKINLIKEKLNMFNNKIISKIQQLLYLKK